MTDPSNADDRPATLNHLIYAVFVLIMAMMLCSNVESCSRRLQINKLRQDLQQQNVK